MSKPEKLLPWIDWLPEVGEAILADRTKLALRLQEADRMEAVFSSAYCVIAATSAEGSSSGFLDRKSRRELGTLLYPNDEEQNPVYFKNRATNCKPNGLIFVEKGVENFDGDVLKGPLNQRGWVFPRKSSCPSNDTLH